MALLSTRCTGYAWDRREPLAFWEATGIDHDRDDVHVLGAIRYSSDLDGIRSLRALQYRLRLLDVQPCGCRTLDENGPFRNESKSGRNGGHTRCKHGHGARPIGLPWQLVDIYAKPKGRPPTPGRYATRTCRNPGPKQP